MKLEEITGVLITGASSPLGIQLAEIFSANGLPLYLYSRDISSLKRFSNVYSIDLTREELSLPDGPFNLVINSAGAGIYGEAISHGAKEQADLVKLNCESLVKITLEASKRFVLSKQKGIILNISSAAGLFPYPTFSVYAATKAFVLNLSRGLDAELKPKGVRVLCALPGQIATSFRERAAKGYPQKKTSGTMSPKKAARLLIKQIEKEIPVYTFDWRYKLGTTFLRCLPSPVRNFFLIRSISDRYLKKSNF